MARIGAADAFPIINVVISIMRAASLRSMLMILAGTGLTIAPAHAEGGALALEAGAVTTLEVYVGTGAVPLGPVFMGPGSSNGGDGAEEGEGASDTGTEAIAEIIGVPTAGTVRVSEGAVGPGRKLSSERLRDLSFDPSPASLGDVGALALISDGAVRAIRLMVHLHPCDALASGMTDPGRVVDGTLVSDIDAEAAMDGCSEATDAFPDEPRFRYQLGRALAAAGRPVEAAEAYRQAAELDYAAAQYNLANQYARGDGVDRDEAEAVRWYRRAAEQGFAKAQNNLGWAYDNGRGVPVDDLEAARWYRLAADQELAIAQANLARLHYLGTAVPQDDVEAVRWYARAAHRGSDEARTSLEALSGHARVMAAQAMLTAAGYDPGPIDGLMGPKTSVAIIAFQRDSEHTIVNGALTTDVLISLATHGDLGDELEPASGSASD